MNFDKESKSEDFFQGGGGGGGGFGGRERGEFPTAEKKIPKKIGIR